MANPKILVFSITGSPSTRVYLTTLEDTALYAALSAHAGSWDVEVYPLTMNGPQTANPWQGLYLDGPVRIESVDSMSIALQNYARHWADLSKEQLAAEVKRCKEFLQQRMEKEMSLIKEEESNPQIEVIDLTTTAPEETNPSAAKLDSD